MMYRCTKQCSGSEGGTLFWLSWRTICLSNNHFKRHGVRKRFQASTASGGIGAIGPAIQGFQGSSLDIFIIYHLSRGKFPKLACFCPSCRKKECFINKQTHVTCPSHVHPASIPCPFALSDAAIMPLFVCFGVLESSAAALPGPVREMLLYQGTRNAFILHLGDTKTQTDDETLRSCSHRFRDVMRKETGQQSPLSASSSKYSLQKARLATSFAAY